MMPVKVKGDADAEIRRAVLRQLKTHGELDQQITAGAIDVAVEDGIVTLTGMVSRYLTKLAAQDAAHRVPGVHAVANDLAVQMPGAGRRTSADIARAARHALSRTWLVPYERIRLSVTDGWMTLEGQVDHPPQRAEAERIVRQVAGVQGVMNRLTVSERDAEPRTEPTMAQPARLLQRARWSRGVAVP